MVGALGHLYTSVTIRMWNPEGDGGLTLWAAEGLPCVAAALAAVVQVSWWRGWGFDLMNQELSNSEASDTSSSWSWVEGRNPSYPRFPWSHGGGQRQR